MVMPSSVRLRKGISIVFQAIGTWRISPSMRTRPPLGSDSTIVLDVPGLRPPVAEKANCKTLRARQSLGQHRRQAIAGDDVKTHRRQQGHALVCGSFAAFGRRHDHVDLAGDVQIVGPGGQAGLHHRAGGLRKGTGAMQHGRAASQLVGDLVGVVQGEAPRFAAQFLRQRGDGLLIAAGQYGLQPRATACRAMSRPV